MCIRDRLKLEAVDLPRYPVRALQNAASLPRGIARMLLAGRIAGARGRKPPSLLLDLRDVYKRQPRSLVREPLQARGELLARELFALAIEQPEHVGRLERSKNALILVADRPLRNAAATRGDFELVVGLDVYKRQM